MENQPREQADIPVYHRPRRANPRTFLRVFYGAWALVLVLFLWPVGEHIYRHFRYVASMGTAASLGDIAAIQRGLANGGSVEARDDSGNTLLIAAVKNSKTEMVDFLLAHGANVDESNYNGDTALDVAIDTGQNKLALKFLAKGANLLPGHPYGSDPPFLRAAAKGNLVLLKDMLARHADVNQQAEPTCTALMRAAEEGQVEMVGLLLAKGATIDTPDDSGRTAMMRAAEHGQLATVQALLANHANINFKDTSGQTALQLATNAAETAVVNALKKAGAK